ncbi:MAG: fumarylacetoacetate hydrolase family protein [Alphaproteobacteria bacterium]|nr:fumarylacetoacetate hydrolase family protein [Alphaproteobacteria bacterium]
MRLATFRADKRVSYGVVVEGGIFDAGYRLAKRFPDLKSVFAGNGLADIEDLARDQKANVLDGDFEYLPPIPNPAKIILAGVNYEPHRIEMGRQKGEYCMLFSRFPDTLVGHLQPIIRPMASTRLDYEGELAVIIGRTGRRISRGEALQYVAGYTCFNDASVRDFQGHTTQVIAGKNFPRTGGFGPWIVTVDEIPDPRKLTLQTRLNGKVMQEGKLAELTFDIPDLIEYVSRWTTLQAGDVISTGTPGGVGVARKPPIFMRHGDEVEVDISGIGILRNPVQDEMDRR